ncbi:hypothetical protein PPTG_16952 [Phytophthora nicotianae INRA-310]|uniref:Core-binding (CB) domain-containing protein n=1 Tax=Phytophthora nicotianae (strain INRA-310) TaxID=761204 RepID=W2PMN7_PHYN3|nr:hypothetical protein PPTG_16952 [Phytophthora nicotianae INRA-310]ETN01876.1 hypothetical protein PPTG_16952 [Phytophthora nicotianae INRA-310]
MQTRSKTASTSGSLVATTSSSGTAALAPTTSSRGLAGADVVLGCREITVQDIRNACVSSKTYRAYKGSLASISKWIRASKGESGSHYFTADGEIDVGVFTARDFESFLLEKRKTVSVVTLSGYRSAIKNLYRRRDVPLPIAYEKSMATFFSGLKRMEATRLQSGSPKESGKDPLPFWRNLMQRISEAALQGGCQITVDMSEQVVEKVFRVGMQNLPLLASTRKRRVSELSLGTTLRQAAQK